MTRIVRQINAAPDKAEDARPRPFSDFAGAPNLVLLGDPGSGKTHLFREAAAAEGARFLKASDFLNMPAHVLTGQALFIDGLDERRSGRSDRGTVDELVSKLWEIKPDKFRISCRVADWLGESDFAALRPYFDQHGDAPVLQLDSLSGVEQRQVLAAQGVGHDAAVEFLAEAEERGLGDFLENPQNLIMLWRAVQTGSWPATRTQLFEMSTGLMLREFNKERARSGRLPQATGKGCYGYIYNAATGRRPNYGLSRALFAPRALSVMSMPSVSLIRKARQTYRGIAPFHSSRQRWCRLRWVAGFSMLATKVRR